MTGTEMIRYLAQGKLLSGDFLFQGAGTVYRVTAAHARNLLKRHKNRFEFLSAEEVKALAKDGFTDFASALKEAEAGIEAALLSKSRKKIFTSKKPVEPEPAPEPEEEGDSEDVETVEL